MSGVKVNVATLTVLPNDAGVELRMRTVEGMDVVFTLDDMALSFLALTAGNCLHARKAGAPVLFKKEDAA